MIFNLIARCLALTGLFVTRGASFATETAKDATDTTQQANNALYSQLPFSDNTDFTNAHKGFI